MPTSYVFTTEADKVPLGLAHLGALSPLHVFTYARWPSENSSSGPEATADEVRYYIRINRLPRRINIPLCLHGFSWNDGHIYDVILLLLASDYLKLPARDTEWMSELVLFLRAQWSRERDCGEPIVWGFFRAKMIQMTADTCEGEPADTRQQIQRLVRWTKSHLPVGLFQYEGATTKGIAKATAEVAQTKRYRDVGTHTEEAFCGVETEGRYWLTRYPEPKPVDDGWLSAVWTDDDPRERGGLRVVHKPEIPVLLAVSGSRGYPSYDD
ncbi:hypothetical protein C8Q76DRAFT_800766 [Earliella scabrosa]|nr:hypothetical protein C8Q76DRAFT_800766 [Earliella scabrosa]